MISLRITYTEKDIASTAYLHSYTQFANEVLLKLLKNFKRIILFGTGKNYAGYKID